MINKTYSSPLCSCVICKKVKSSKGIHSHYLVTHTEEGQLKIKRAGSAGAKAGAKAYSLKIKAKRKLTESDYLKNANYCKCCGILLEFNKRFNQYCSRTCSVKISNQRKKGITRSKETKSKISNTIKQKFRDSPYTKIKFKICKYCNANFIWSPGISKSQQWCSNECIISGRSQLARNNPGLCIKRSKLEIELFELCKSNFKNVTNNEAIFNNWDADILIYDFKFAILWNGPWHYKQMGFGNHSLKQVQNRDSIKIKEIKLKGWIPIIFEDRYFTPESALKYLIGESTRIRTETMPC